MRCPKCGGYRFDSNDRCQNCGDTVPRSKVPRHWRVGGSTNVIATSSSKKDDGGIETSSLEDSELKTNRQLKVCPRCSEKSLFLNYYTELYECLKCKRRYTPKELGIRGEHREAQLSNRSGSQLQRVVETMKGIGQMIRRIYTSKATSNAHYVGKGPPKKRGIFSTLAESMKRNTWLKSLRQRTVKTLLCLTALGLFVFFVWSAFFVFQQKEHPIYGISPTTGAIAILLTIIALIINIKVLQSRRYKRTAPSFLLVFLSVVAVFLIFAFAGVEPMSQYKDDAIDSLKSAFQTSDGDIIPSAPQQPVKGTSPSPTLNIKPQYGVPKIVEDNWAITLNSVRWENDIVTVGLTIEYRGTKIATFCYDDTSGHSSQSTFLVMDSMGNRAALYEKPLSPEEMAEKLWYGGLYVKWFQGDYWPQELRSGEIEFEMGPSSTGVILYLKKLNLYRGLYETTPLFEIPR